MSLTPNLGLTLLDPAQAQKEVTINADWTILDNLVTKKTGDTMTGTLNINVTAAPGLNITLSDTGGGSDVPALRPTFLQLRHFTSATTVPGTGHGIDFRTKDASGTEVSIGRQMVEITTATAGSVESTQGWSAFSNNQEVEVFRVVGSIAASHVRLATSDPAGAMFTGVPGLVGGKLYIRGSFQTQWVSWFTRDAVTTGSPDPSITMVVPADTGLTASTENISVKLDCSATRQWATGNIGTQREVFIQGPTYSFVGASTITNAATVHILGSPVAGTNATLTNVAALWVQGAVNFGNLIQGTSKAGQSYAQGRNTTQPNGFYTQPFNNGSAFTASVETYLTFWDPTNGTLLWATGNLTNQRENWFRNPTYTAQGASTFTNSATVAIEGAPVAGSNLTITNSYALWLQAGGLRVTGHLCFDGGSAPGAAAGSNAGGSPPAPVVNNANDTRGNITFGTGTAPAAGNMVVVTFAAAFSAAAQPVVMVVPKNAATAALQLYVTSVSTTGFTLACGVAPAASQVNTTYSFDFHAMG